jgi:hypothetical protein
MTLSTVSEWQRCGQRRRRARPRGPEEETEGQVSMKLKHFLAGLGLVFVIIGHLGDGTVTREMAFWLGIVMSLIGLGLGMRGERK